jgi:transmembrane sensor
MNKEKKDILNGNPDDNFDKIFELTSKLKVPSSTEGKEVVWNKLMQSIEQNGNQEVKPISLFSSRRIWYSVAATLIVLITIASITYTHTTLKVQISKGETANKVLPDGSEIKLNADSKIEYRKFGWLSNRVIKISGEAFFSVKHGNRFTVLTDYNRKITVTGTKFNVFARGNRFEVRCFEGSITVETESAKPIGLTKGKGISINKIKETPTQFELDSITQPTWTKGEFYFSNTTLNIVLDELSRQFSITIKSIDVNPESRKFTGYFKRNRIVQALDLVCIPMGLTYQFSSDSTSVIIKNQ